MCTFPDGVVSSTTTEVIQIPELKVCPLLPTLPNLLRMGMIFIFSFWKEMQPASYLVVTMVKTEVLPIMWMEEQAGLTEME